MIRRDAQWTIPATRWLLGVLLWTGPGRLAGAVDTQAPSVPGELAASEIAVTGLTLGWQASTDNVKVTAYEVAKNGASAGTTTKLTKSFAALTPATSYTFTVRARDAKGNWSAPSLEFVVATLPDVTPPSAPAEVAGSELALKAFTLSWAAAVDDVRVTGYEVFKNGASLGSTTARSKRITGLSPGQTYAMTVRARDAAGNWSVPSGEVILATLADTAPPAVPAELKASSITAIKFTLKWAAAKDDVKVTAYEVFQDGVSLGATSTTSRSVVGLAPATRYAMTVRAGDAAGNWSEQSEVLSVTTALDTNKPSVPGELTVSSVSPVGFTLSWTPSTDNVGVTGYEVFRAGVSQGVATSPAFTFAGLTPATTYAVRVRARDAAGNWSGQSAHLKVKTAAADVMPPSVPARLVSSDLTATGFVLTWAPASDDVGVTAYEVFQNGVSVGTTTLTTMAVNGLSPGASNRLTVRAGDAAGNWSDLSAGLDVMFTGVPFIAGFEPAEGYQPGPLHGQNGWSVTGAAEIVTSAMHAGMQAVSVPPAAVPSFATRAFSGPATGVVFTDLFALPAAAATPEAGVFFETDTAEVALTGSAGVGRLQAFNGDGAGGGAWVSAGTGPELDAFGQAARWLRLTVRSDFIAKKWDLYFDGRIIAANLGFVTNRPVAPEAVSLGGHLAAVTGFDDLLVAFENPLFADADLDGMEDAWEVAHGLNPAVNDRDVGVGGEGLTGIQSYLLSSNPDTPDSDNDGLPDAWERQQLGTLSYGPGMDPGGEGRTLLQSYRQNVSPWPAPPLPAGVRAWFRADLGGESEPDGRMRQWTDLSGRGFHAVQWGGREQYPHRVMAGLNGQAVIRFDGAREYLELADVMAGATSGEMFIVARLQDFSNPYNGLAHFGTGYATVYAEDAVWDDFGTSALSPYTGFPTAQLTQPHLYDSSITAEGESVLRFNGVEVGRRSGQVVLFSAYPEIGADQYGEFFKGEIAEVIVYDRVLTDEERTTIARGLNQRYAFVPPAEAPLNLAATALSPTSVKLTWNQAQPDQTAAYAIERKGGGEGGFAVVGGALGTAGFIDPSLVPATSYTYRLKATGTFGGSAVSNEATVLTPADADGDGVSDVEELINHTDPQDYYNGLPPILTLLSGDAQYAQAGEVLPEPLVVRVTRQDGTPLANAPLAFKVKSQGGMIRLGAGSVESTALTRRTNAAGEAQVDWRMALEAEGALNVLGISTVSPASREILSRANVEVPAPYVAVKLIPSTLADAARLTPVKVTGSGYALLSYAPGSPGGAVGQRWKAGRFTALLSATDAASPRWPSPVDVPWMRSDFNFYPHTDDPTETWRAEEALDLNEAGTVVGAARFGPPSNPAHAVHFALPVWLAGSAGGSVAQPRFTNSDMPLDPGLFIYYAAFYGATITNEDTIYTVSLKEILTGDGDGYEQVGLMARSPEATPLTMVAEARLNSEFNFYISPNGRHRMAHWGKTPAIHTLNEVAMAQPAIGPINDVGRYITPDSWGEGGGGLNALPGLKGGAALAINASNQILARRSDGVPLLLTWLGDTAAGAAGGYYFQEPLRFATPVGWELQEMAPTLSDTGQLLGRLKQVGNSAGVPLAPAEQTTVPALFLHAQLAVDNDRDGQINPGRMSDRATASRPFRLWINDDDDSDDTGGSDLPDGASPEANFKDGVVNGTRDLVDFSPVFLDIKELLEALPPGTPYRYRLKHATGALNFVYTSLPRDRALAYHRELLTTGWGDTFSSAAGSAATHPITAAGTELSSAYLDGIQTAGWGVILVEGRAVTDEPLKLCVEQADGTIMAELKLDLRIRRVEDMFRHLNLRAAVRNYDGSPAVPSDPGPATRMADPVDALPDVNSNGKYFVFVHGYNVDGSEARGWDSELFKRMYALGSRARFVGVSWNGSTGVDYHQAVFHAFQTGDLLNQALGLPAGADVTVAAHSLGNVVVSQAIQSGGFSPARYYMLNAAVPLEAYDLDSVTAAQRTAMTEHKWKTLDSGLFASNWHKVFNATPSDHRNELTWKKRFMDVLRLTPTYNFYSPGEDVVENPEWDSPSLLNIILTQGFNVTRGAWVTQEFIKGAGLSNPAAVGFFSRIQGGWGLSIYADQLNNAPLDLAHEPYFGYFLEHALFGSDPVQASVFAAQKMVQYDLLARGIPALSFAVAANQLTPLAAPLRNFDMEDKGRTANLWPSEGHTANASAGRWLHSDLRNVALPFVYKLYDEMIALGSLR
jgi:chitodextrinase